MFKCKDPLADLLKDYGFNLILLPKPDIEPLQLLVKENNRLERVGHLRDLFKKGESVAMPRKSKDIPLAKELQNKKSSGIKAKFGISILSNFLSSMAASKAKVDTKDTAKKTPEPKADFELTFGDVDTLFFAYKNVTTSEVNHIKIDQYLHDAILNEKARNFIDKLKNNQIYIITAVLKSNAFETEFVDKKNHGVNIGLPQIRKIIAPEISVGIDKENSSKMVCESEENLVFGFKAVRILYDEKKDLYKLKSVDGIIMRHDDDFPVENIETDDTLVDLL